MFTNVDRPSAVDVLRPFTVGDQFYADTTSTLAKRAIGSTNDVYTVSGGVPVWSSSITLATLTVTDSGFNIVGNVDSTKKRNFQVDTQGAGFTFTEDVGAQTASRTATYPVLTGNSIYAMSNATLTSTRVPYATTNGILTDAATMTFDGTKLTVGNLLNSGLTASRLVRSDASKNLESNAALTNTRVLYADSNGWPTDSANLTFSGTLLTLGTGATGGLTIAATTGTTLTVSSTTDSTSKDTGSIVTEGGIGAEKQITSGTKVVAVTRLVGVSETAGVYSIEGSLGARIDYTSSDTSSRYAGDFRRTSNTTASGTHNARGIFGKMIGTISSGQTNSGQWNGLWFEAMRNYDVASDTGTLTALEGIRVTAGHFNFDASTPTTTTIKGIYVPLYRSTGTIGTMYGMHIDNGSTTVTPTTGYGIRIENVTGTTSYAIYTNSGIVRIGDTTAATSSTTGALTVAGGVAINGALWINSATMISSSTSFTNGAGANTGTLTNSPATGNPTKWIPVNDNGTTRYIPAW